MRRNSQIPNPKSQLSDTDRSPTPRFPRALREASRLTFIACLALCGCAVPHYAKGQWPEALPPESHYGRAYNADAENAKVQTAEQYFDWVLRFYRGYSFYPGWGHQEKTLAKMMTAEEWAALAPRVGELARVISTEWSKDNRVRKLDSDMLVLWGGVLKKAAGLRRVDAAVARLHEDAEAVSAGKLGKAEVTAARYEGLVK